MQLMPPPPCGSVVLLLLMNRLPDRRFMQLFSLLLIPGLRPVYVGRVAVSYIVVVDIQHVWVSC